MPQELVASWKSTKPRHGSRRNMSYETLGIHEDSNCGLIDSREEYGSSTYSSNHSSEENVVSDGVSESMC